MTGFPLLKVAFILNLIAVLFVISCVILTLVILIQKGKGGGLSSAFGGGGAGGLLGSKTGDFLTWVTIVLVGIMLLFAVILAKYYRPAPDDITVNYPTTQTQQETPSAAEEPVSQPNTVTPGNNDSNSILVKPAVPVNETPVTPVENTVNTNVNTNQSNEVNQPGN
jgi:preprotein translocase subunit SecG